MAILVNKPASVSADSTTSLELNKTDLQAKLVALDAGAYWENQATWKGVAFLFENNAKQKAIAVFDVVSGVTTNLTVSEYFVDGAFECKRIDVLGFANDFYTIYRSDFGTASEFDITLTDGYAGGGGGGGGGSGGSGSGEPGLGYVVWNQVLGHTVEPDGGIYGGSGIAAALNDVIPAGTSGEFTFVVNNLNGTNTDFYIGVGPFQSTSTNSFFGLCWLFSTNFALLIGPIVDQDIKANALVDMSGEIIIRIAREGNSMKIYVNNTLFYTASASTNTGAGTLDGDIVPAVRTMGTPQNTGLIKAYRTA